MIVDKKYGAFSHDVTLVILIFQTNPVGVKLFSYTRLREWKRFIEDRREANDNVKKSFNQQKRIIARFYDDERFFLVLDLDIYGP